MISFRGSKNASIVDNGYQNLKTYNIGNDISWYDWNQYIIQLINLGYLEIAFHEKNSLKLTKFAKKVLFEAEKVQLNSVVKLEIEKKDVKEKSFTVVNSLFETLRKLGSKIAIKEVSA